MHIDVKKLESLGFVVEARGPKDHIESIEIFPRSPQKDAHEIIEREFELQPKYVYEIVEAIHELQVIQAIRQT